MAIGLTGCTEKELETNQYSDSAVTLASFGPNPVMRGAQLRFFGSNLQNITEVMVPGMSSAITNIEVVSSGKVSEIRIALPLEGPEEGIVTLRTADGKEFKTRSSLTYTEAIEFDSFSVAEPAYPGDVVTINGDYIHLVQSVTFAGGEKVNVEEGSTRHEAKVVIPATAVTGKIILSDGAEVENLFYSEKDLVIGKPSVTKASKQNVKAGQTLTVSGKHLEMISHFIFTKGEESDVIDTFSLAEDNASITVAVPDFATDGSFKAVSFAGDEFTAGEIALIMPSSLKVENTPKAGETLNISGADLDAVARVDLPGNEDASFAVENGVLKVQVSDLVTEGDAVLYLSNGEYVTIPFTIVKPVISSVSPLELYAGDDEPIVVKGTDLDLVVAAQMAGKDLTIKEKSATELQILTAITSSSGKLVLILANGEKIESTEEVSLKYHSKVIVTEMPAAQHIGQTVTIKGQNMDLIENIFIGDEKVTKYAIRTAEEVSFLMPYNKVGFYDVKFALFDGDTEIQPNQIEVLLEQIHTVAFEGSAAVSWNNAVTIPASSLKRNAIVVVEYEVVPAEYSMLRIINPDWSFNPDGDNEYNKRFDESGVWEFTITSELLTNLDGKDMVFTGNGCNITKVTLIENILQEKTIFEGPLDMTWGDDGRFGIATEAFSGVQAGAKLVFYLTHTASWGQIQINDGWWGNSDVYFPEVGGAYIKTDLIPEGATRVELTLTESMIEIINNRIGNYQGMNTKYASPSGSYSLVIQGSDMRIESIAIL